MTIFPKAGDTVRVPKYYFGKFSHFAEYELQEFNFCLGFYDEENGPITPSNFTPLSSLYEPAPDSEEVYISNFGSVHTHYIQPFEIIAKPKE